MHAACLHISLSSNCPLCAEAWLCCVVTYVLGHYWHFGDTCMYRALTMCCAREVGTHQIRGALPSKMLLYYDIKVSCSYLGLRAFPHLIWAIHFSEPRGLWDSVSQWRWAGQGLATGSPGKKQLKKKKWVCSIYSFPWWSAHVTWFQAIVWHWPAHQVPEHLASCSHKLVRSGLAHRCVHSTCDREQRAWATPHCSQSVGDQCYFYYCYYCCCYHPRRW
jgi:hypothetical protein